MKLKGYAKNILTICSFTLLLQTTHVAHPAIGDTFRKAVGSTKQAFSKFGKSIKETAQKAGSSVTSSIEKAYNNYFKINTTILVDKLIAQISKLEQQFRDYGARIITGELTGKEKVSLAATATAIAAITAIVIGIAIHKIKGQKKDISQRIENISESTQTDTKASFVQKAKMRISKFKQDVLALKQCLKTKQCSSNQKAFIYGAAITLVATVMIVIGVAVGLYLKSKREKEAALPPGVPGIPQAPAGAPQIGPPSAPGGPLKLPEQISPEMAQQLSEEIPIGGIAPATTPFGRFFEKIIRVDSTGKNIFQTSLKKVEHFLKDKTEKAKQALHKVGEVKNKLVAQAREAYNKAAEEARQFIIEVRQGGPDFFKEMLTSLFDISYKKIKEAIARIKQSITGVNNNIATLNNEKIWQKFNSIMINWNAVQKKAYALLWRQLPSEVKPTDDIIAQQKIILKGPKYAQNITNTMLQLLAREAVQLVRKVRPAEYPLATKFDALRSIYEKQFIPALNVELRGTGQAIQSVINQTATIFQAIANTYSGAGIWGKLLMTDAMIGPLQKASSLLKEAGENLTSIMETEPLQQLAREFPQKISIEEIPIGTWLSLAVWHPIDTINDVQDIWNNLTPKILESSTQLLNAIQQTTDLSNTLMTHSSNMWQFIKQRIQESLAEKPFQNYISLANKAVRAEAKISKELFNDTLLSATGIVNYLEKILSSISSIVVIINERLGKQLITSDNIAKLRKNSDYLRKITKELADLRNAAKTAIRI